MVAKNDITGDSIQSRVGSEAYKKNLEAIFGEKKIKDNTEYFARLAAETKARMEGVKPANEFQDILSTEDCLMSGLDCHRCYEEANVMVDKMIVCPECGNKRCPRASDHRLACTGSNEPGQPGSVY